MLPVLVALASADARADHNELELGVLRITPLGTSTALTTEINPTLVGSALGLHDFDSPGTQFHPGNATTLAAAFVHVLGEHFAVKFEGGIPPQFRLYGTGTVTPPGPAGAVFNLDLGAVKNQPLATAREWSPTVLFQYRPLPEGHWFQPYIGIGISYTFFTGVKLGSGIDSDLNSQFGAPLALAALKPGPTSAKAHASSSLVPAFNGGAAIRLDKHWAIVGSISYALLATTARIDLRAADGTQLGQSRTNIVLNPLIAGLLLNYRFGGTPIN